MKVPVIPVAVVGTDVVAPPGKKFGRVTRPLVRFGAPLDFSRYEGLENDRFILRSITDEIMYEIMQLSGQEYVDKYASQARDEAKKAERARAEADRAEARRVAKEKAANEAAEKAAQKEAAAQEAAARAASPRDESD